MRMAIPAAIMAVATAAAAWPAAAQPQDSPPCAPREVALRMLAEKYSEVPVAIGALSSGALIEITGSPDGGFSVLVTDPQSGVTCMVNSGDGFRAITPKPAGEGA